MGFAEIVIGLVLVLILLVLAVLLNPPSSWVRAGRERKDK
jgi:hypothetical protein